MKMRRVLVLGAELCSCTALVLALNISPPVQKAKSAAEAAQMNASQSVNAELQRSTGQASIQKTASLPEQGDRPAPSEEGRRGRQRYQRRHRARHRQARRPHQVRLAGCHRRRPRVRRLRDAEHRSR